MIFMMISSKSEVEAFSRIERTRQATLVIPKSSLPQMGWRTSGNTIVMECGSYLHKMDRILSLLDTTGKPFLSTHRRCT
ncbi:hypothetical protein LENED_005003 [Lentinula edodes]|uniref:Uncharacterized protein n=1 Tax=Lentinula edodes TaxID=5353 RepID=A0A1Q3E898_LENED|nr:hypothetical protein LENED_005003 [Lentinula edodes]